MSWIYISLNCEKSTVLKKLKQTCLTNLSPSLLANPEPYVRASFAPLTWSSRHAYVKLWWWEKECTLWYEVTCHTILYCIIPSCIYPALVYFIQKFVLYVAVTARELYTCTCFWVRGYSNLPAGNATQVFTPVENTPLCCPLLPVYEGGREESWDPVATEKLNVISAHNDCA